MTTPPAAPRAPAAAPDLLARIDAGIRERLEEAVDDTCLSALVRARESSGRQAPVADSAEDRAEFQAMVRGFLRRLQRDMPVARKGPPEGGPAAAGAANVGATTGRDSAGGEPGHTGEAPRERPHIGEAGTGQAEVAALIRVQVGLAKEIPDYWQRFDAVRAAYVEDTAASSGQRPGFLRRLLGR